MRIKKEARGKGKTRIKKRMGEYKDNTEAERKEGGQNKARKIKETRNNGQAERKNRQE